MSGPRSPVTTYLSKSSNHLARKPLDTPVILKLGLWRSSSAASPSLLASKRCIAVVLNFRRPDKACEVPFGWTLDGRLWIPESITAGGIRIAFIAARRITASKKRIGKDVPAIQRA